MTKALVSGSRLKVRVLRGADGSMAPVTSLTSIYFFDTQRSEECSPARTSDLKVRCVGVRGYSTTLYADSTCTGNFVAIVYDSPVSKALGFSTPKLFAEGPGTNAVTDLATMTLYALGAEIAQPYEKKDGTCQATTPKTGDKYFARGAEIPVTEFAELTPGLL